MKDGVTRRATFGAFATGLVPLLPPEFRGDPGSAGNVAATLALLKAAPITNNTMLYDSATFKWTLGNYAGLADDTNIVQSDNAAITVGAWKRQAATSVTYKAPGTGSRTRTIQDALGDRLSLASKGTTADALTALTSAGTDLITGGEIFVPRGNWSLSATWTFSGQRISLRGDTANISNFVFNPAAADVAIDLDSGGGGGQNQSSIRNIGFISANTVAKTAIRLYNVANVVVQDVGISSGVWLGNSIGIQTLGRQKVEIQRATIGCARPIVCSRNPAWPMLSVDHFQIVDSELVGTSSSYPVIEFENGVSFSNTTIRGVAVVGGKDGIRWVDTGGVVGAGFHLHFEDIRFEQGLDAAAYSVRLETVNNSLQTVLFTNCLFDAARHGVYLRQCRHVTFINCTFDTAGKTALDMTMVPGTTLKFVNCSGAGAFTITNGRCVSKSGDNRVLGFTEEWVHDAGTSAGALQTETYLGGVPFTLADNATAEIADDTFTGFVIITTNLDVSAMYVLTGATHSVAEVSDPFGFFTAVKDSVALNVYWDAGSSRYLVQNKRGGGAVTFTALRLGSTA